MAVQVNKQKAITSVESFELVQCLLRVVSRCPRAAAFWGMRSHCDQHCALVATAHPFSGPADLSPPFLHAQSIYHTAYLREMFRDDSASEDEEGGLAGMGQAGEASGLEGLDAAADDDDQCCAKRKQRSDDDLFATRRILGSAWLCRSCLAAAIGAAARRAAAPARALPLLPVRVPVALISAPPPPLASRLPLSHIARSQRTQTTAMDVKTIKRGSDGQPLVDWVENGAHLLVSRCLTCSCICGLAVLISCTRPSHNALFA